MLRCFFCNFLGRNVGAVKHKIDEPGAVQPLRVLSHRRACSAKANQEFLDKIAEFIRWSRRQDLSPLRYPGGKRRLMRAFVPIIVNLGQPVKLFVEPFAGGAAVSLAMLESGLAEKVALADRDDWVGSFWKVVFSGEAWKLADRILDADVSLQKWKELRDQEPKCDLDRAFKCFFLNRTSFSGILCQKAGPIGGKAQASQYKIDCRYNRQELAERIERLSKLQGRVLFARTATYCETFSAIKRSRFASEPQSVLWYLDPPFFEKAVDLYRFYFREKDHLKLREEISRLSKFNWILSYDNVERARELYAGAPGFYFATPTYVAAESGVRKQASELIVTNVRHLAVLQATRVGERRRKCDPMEGRILQKRQALVGG